MVCSFESAHEDIFFITVAIREHDTALDITPLINLKPYFDRNFPPFHSNLAYALGR